MEEEGFPGLPAIDLIANGEQFLMLKAALPFLDLSVQQPLAVYIKMMELQNILHFYQQPKDMSMCSLSSRGGSLTDILQEMCRYSSPAKRGQFQQCLQIMQAMELMSAFQSEGGQSDVLENLLSPEQKEMFETYQTMFSST